MADHSRKKKLFAKYLQVTQVIQESHHKRVQQVLQRE